MRTITKAFTTLTLTAALALVSMAQATTQTKPPATPAKPATMTATQPKPAAAPAAKPADMKAAKKPMAGKSDSEIQSCIQTRLANAPKMKEQGFSASVSGGVATFTGTTRNAGTKGGVSGMAKACGASKTVNNITIEKAAKPAAPAAKPKP
jgi:osmotically-inducible protein OsmY